MKITKEQQKGMLVCSLLAASMLDAMDNTDSESVFLQHFAKTEKVLQVVYDVVYKALATKEGRDSFAFSVPFDCGTLNEIACAIQAAITLQNLDKLAEYKSLKEALTYSDATLQEKAKGAQIARNLLIKSHMAIIQ